MKELFLLLQDNYLVLYKKIHFIFCNILCIIHIYKKKTYIYILSINNKLLIIKSNFQILNSLLLFKKDFSLF
jgi:hypothetical protein